MLDKPQLRRTLKERRRAIDHATRLAWDDRIGARVLAWWQANPGTMLGVYWPLAGEPDLRPAYAELADAGVRLALPVVLARDTALGFAEWVPGEPTVADSLGVAVPADLRMVERPDALLVPCLGFDARFMTGRWRHSRVRGRWGLRMRASWRNSRSGNMTSHSIRSLRKWNEVDCLNTQP